MHQQIEEYLADVTAQLGSLPQPRRDEEILELREHLMSAVSAHQELGQSLKDAVATALAEFGSPQLVSANVLWAWRRQLRKEGVKTFCKIEGIWSAFAAFQIVFGSHTLWQQRNWFFFWVSSMIMSFLFLMVFPHWLMRKSGSALKSG